jgi:hypothetical protein
VTEVSAGVVQKRVEEVQQETRGGTEEKKDVL